MIALVMLALAMLAMFMARKEAVIWHRGGDRLHRERAVFFAGISSGLMIAAVLTIISLVIRG